ncbi:MAG: TIGR03118 family protein [Steroidobacteraceae bacterium]
MSTFYSYWSIMAAGAGALALSACGGSGMQSSSPPSVATTDPAAVTNFANTALVSNTAAGTVDTLPSNTVASGDSSTFTFPQTQNSSLDPNLSHPWGVAFGPGSAVWVNDHASNLSSLYDGNGNVIPTSQQPAVAIPPNAGGAAAGPTGIVANIDTSNCATIAASTCAFGKGFVAGAGPAEFIFDGTGGTISAWATGGTAITEFDGSATDDSFTGLAIYTQSSGLTFILAADFHNGVVDVFDSSFQPNTTAFPDGFHDPNLPAGYAPFGIQTIGNLIYVSYAEQPATPGPEVDGEGLGMVDVFDGSGVLMKELILTGGALNAPWGMAMAPQGFGPFGGDLLVGNFGDGRINAFDPSTGDMVGTLTDSATGNAIHIPGLWGIAFGNGALEQSASTLYYAAAPDMKTQGLYGSLVPAPAKSSSGSTTSMPSNPDGY